MLFAGTIRDQLDPHNQFDDAAVWRALAHANMEDHVGGLDGKLQAEVTNGGANFSAGQKQLLTLAAAILRKRKIVIFDEATSSTDAETDAIVQRTIRQEFADCTILTIAHRINTIQDSDMILVLDKGRVAEFAPPAELLAKEDSLYAQLVKGSQTA
ncbi:P-loop containing nucleoside triphosphate hydrolase protein [Blastocladiella britannica]|nr:P-loop containing nucleoside triphosphate hydrolase protein [Blastocladiella britannica]